MESKRKKIVVAASGGFDPLHSGHVRLLQEAKNLGTELVVILNNDNWLKRKKGFVFIPEKERKEVLKAIKWVDKVILTGHGFSPKDMSVSVEIKKIKPNIFVNGGDRNKKNIPEVAICKKINCKMVFNIGKGGKIQSSSWLINNFLKRINNKS